MEQKWFGWVEEMHVFHFTCRLKDLTNKGTDEKADILYTDISEEDRRKVRIGSTFNWTIDENESKIEFIQHNEPSEEEIDLAKRIKNAKRYFNTVKHIKKIK